MDKTNNTALDDPEPQRYYDWMLWKMRQNQKRTSCYDNRRNDEKRNCRYAIIYSPFEEMLKNWSKKTRN